MKVKCRCIGVNRPCCRSSVYIIYDWTISSCKFAERKKSYM